MTDVKPGCIHPGDGCGNTLLKLGLLAAFVLVAITVRRGWTP